MRSNEILKKLASFCIPVSAKSSGDLDRDLILYYCSPRPEGSKDKWDWLEKWIQSQNGNPMSESALEFVLRMKSFDFFLPAMLCVALKFHLQHISTMMNESNLENDEDIPVIKELISKLYTGTLSENDLFDRPIMHSTMNVSYMEEMDRSTEQPHRRLSLSETFQSLNSSVNDSPALAKAQKRKGFRLIEQIARDGEIENEELCKENDSLKDRIKEIEIEKSKLESQLNRQSDYKQLQEKNEQLCHQIEEHSEHLLRLKKFTKENECLQDKLAKMTNAKNDAVYETDDLKNKNEEIQSHASNMEEKVKELQEKIDHLTNHVAELERQKSYEAQMMAEQEQQRNESANDSRLSNCDPPSFSRLNNTDTPNFQLEMDLENKKEEISRLNEELEKSSALNNEIKANLEKVESNYNEANVKNEQLVEELTKIERHRNDLVSKSTQLDKSNNELTEQIQQLHEQKLEIEIIVKNKTDEIEQIESKLSSMDQKNKLISR